MSLMTTTEKERMLREKGLAFFGTITALVSHELANTIAIIEQTAGLLQDLTGEAEGEHKIGAAELRSIADRVGRQAVRGATIVKRLNAFAHSMDESERELDLNELAEDVVAFSQRSADQKRLELEISSSGSPVTVRGNPFEIQQALFLSIQQAMSLAEAREKITIAITNRDSCASVAVRCEPTDPSRSPELGYLGLLVSQIGGEIETVRDEGRMSLELTIPHAPRGCS